MYNEEYKRRFIEERKEEVVLPNNYLERQFNYVTETEEKLGKDISNFSFYEILEYYKMLNLSSTEVLEVMNSQFSNYTQWCLQQNLVKDGQNHFLEFKIEDFLKCVNKIVFNAKIIDYHTVLEWVEQLSNPRDQFILLGLFEGIKGKDFCELAKLRPEDVDTKNNVLSLCTGRQVKVSNKLINIIGNCITEKNYYSVTGKNVKVMPLVNRGYVIKDYPNIKDDVSDFQNGRRIYNSLQRIVGYFGASVVTANAIVESGKIYAIKQRAKELKMDCKEFIYSEYIREIEDKFGCTILKNRFILKYEGFLAS